MHPARRNKVDISKLTPEEKKLFDKYGKLPTHKNILMKMQKDRKYFDSGDYALSKAGVTPQSTVGTAIPNPEKYVFWAVYCHDETLRLSGSPAYLMPHPASPTVTRCLPFPPQPQPAQSIERAAFPKSTQNPLRLKRGRMRQMKRRQRTRRPIPSHQRQKW
ncbi:hypothetical protein AN958_07578 [Leucoagaricus sp. SymC.cos]|nr:hypothetical protein AN958_07578 [Leucoagaricus sp. SymC.cos]